jgi:hypothetical protein
MTTLAKTTLLAILITLINPIHVEAQNGRSNFVELTPDDIEYSAKKLGLKLANGFPYKPWNDKTIKANMGAFLGKCETPGSVQGIEIVCDASSVLKETFSELDKELNMRFRFLKGSDGHGHLVGISLTKPVDSRTAPFILQAMRDQAKGWNSPNKEEGDSRTWTCYNTNAPMWWAEVKKEGNLAVLEFQYRPGVDFIRHVHAGTAEVDWD